ncbi:hypothetical protein SERLADRAFT_464431 [Serpula lacrymans var. lacrymans S7.9]|nr:uncharacterized protein SERLADRAFT_464431 [Serpula lacrymans var. lacrymans S7.9]EGO26872.1 hypothetical protein SERLADRAFT_464431 [Serpula lacrymans var. lacrymans S7.9]
MPATTRRETPRTSKPPSATKQKTTPHPDQQHDEKTEIESHPKVGEKREADNDEGGAEEPPSKKAKSHEDDAIDYSFQEGVIERGHIYFFYRPKVQHEEAHSLDHVKNMHILLVPRPPVFSAYDPQVDKVNDKVVIEQEGNQEMNLILEGADALPAPESRGVSKKTFRLITIGKKKLPNPEGSGRKDTFWAVVTTVGDDLHSLESGLGEKTYETKTRGTRHEEPVRLAGRGAYAIANQSSTTPSSRETHLGYHLSHPNELGDVQNALGIHLASSFVLQVKNPLAPATGPQRIGLPKGRRAEYSSSIMDQVFGKGTRGRQSYGLRFSACNHIDLLNHKGAELLLIAARTGASGNDQSLGEGRGEALQEAEENEGKEPVEDVFKELAMDKDVFPAEPLQGEWI